MNTKAKGRRAEYKSKKFLEAQGYKVTRSAASLGTFDLVAFSKRDTLLVQVKAGSSKVSKKERLAMEAFPSGPFCIKVIHHWPERAKEPLEKFVNNHVEAEMHPVHKCMEGNCPEGCPTRLCPGFVTGCSCYGEKHPWAL